MYDNDSDPLNGPRVPEGTYRATGVPGSAQLGETESGNPQLAASFKIASGELEGECVPWYAYFTEKTEKRTLESLRLAGWSNDDIANIEGFGDAEVDIVVEHNEWNGKVSARVSWVNRPGSGVALRNPMDEAKRKAFAARMKGKAVQSRQGAAPVAPSKSPPKKSAAQQKVEAAFPPAPADDDLPF